MQTALGSFKDWNIKKCKEIKKCKNKKEDTIHSWKKSNRLVTVELKKAHFDHFPRPEESDMRNMMITALSKSKTITKSFVARFILLHPLSWQLLTTMKKNIYSLPESPTFPLKKLYVKTLLWEGSLQENSVTGVQKPFLYNMRHEAE